MSYPYRQARFDYGVRKGATLALCLHMTEGGGGIEEVEYLERDPARGVSANFLALADGTIYQMLDITHASGSLHPGDISTRTKPYYGGQYLKACLPDPLWRDPNSYIISIEIGGKAVNGPTPAQVKAIIAWGLDMRRRFPSIIGAFGHADQTDQKACPGTTSNMKAIFAGIGGHGRFTSSAGPSQPIEDAPMIYTHGGVQLATISQGTGTRDVPGGPFTGKPLAADTRVVILGYDASGKYAECSGLYASLPTSKLTACKWVSVSALGDITTISPAPPVTPPVEPPDCTIPVATALQEGYASAKADALAAVQAIEPPKP